VILLAGIPSEPPLARVQEELEGMGVPVVVFNQRAFAEAEVGYRVTGDSVTGVLRLGRNHHYLEDFDAVYLRLMDDQDLPEVRTQPWNSPVRGYARSVHDALVRWSEITPGRVVNRSAPMASNGSKPYQAQLIQAAGFAVPETLVTNDPELVHEFASRQGRLVYKSISGLRSIVQELRPSDISRLGRIRWCPTQFQQFVDGVDVRVHVVGAEAIATAVFSSTVDYRYAHREGGTVDLKPAELSPEIESRCVELAARLDLPLAGIDLKLTADGDVYCLEVNPSPAFTFYETAAGQPIARAIARHLAGSI
jgi:hypothetical protein